MAIPHDVGADQCGARMATVGPGGGPRGAAVVRTRWHQVEPTSPGGPATLSSARVGRKAHAAL